MPSESRRLEDEIETLRSRREMLEIDSASYSSTTLSKVSGPQYQRGILFDLDFFYDVFSFLSLSKEEINSSLGPSS